MKKCFILFFILFVSVLTNSFGQKVLTFTSSGSFTVPLGISTITVEGWGGGGGGGGASATTGSAGGGGGGGAYARSVLGVIPGNTYTYVVGLGGVGGAGNAGNVAAGSGGDTYFNNTGTLLAKGGSGGYTGALGIAGIGGVGGTTAASIGQVEYSGGNGASGSLSTYSGGGGESACKNQSGFNAFATTGGSSSGIGCALGSNGFSAGSLNGLNGISYGGGASGGLNRLGTTARSGGSGGNGILIIYYNSPKINSFSPVSGPVGTSVNILGSGFSTTLANNKVSFGGVLATVTGATGTTLIVTVPAGASFDRIQVRNGGFVALSELPFNVTNPCGNVSFGLQTPYTTQAGPRPAAVGDFNNDGKVDFVVGNSATNSLSVFTGLGTGAFGPQAPYSSTSSPLGLALGDFNADGFQDIAAANNGSNSIRVLTGTGTGAFGPQLTLTVGLAPRSVAVGDFNKDGFMDIVASNFNNNSVSVLTGSGIGTFGTQATYPTGTNPNGLVVGDFNADGNQDLAIANEVGTSISILTGSGTGAFGTAFTKTVGTTPRSVAYGDFNRDGRLDLAVANFGSNNISVLTATGTGNFGNSINYPVNGGPQFVAVGDFNGDGFHDLASASSTLSTVSLLIGKGDGSFNTQINFPVGNFPYCVGVGDFNGDGKQDLIAPNFNGNNVSVLLNNCAPCPIFSSFTSSSGGIGSVITLNGSNFSGINSVSFGGITASSFIVVNSTTITAVVGSGASGTISVVSNCGAATIAGFAFILPASVTSFTPISGPVGAAVTINGVNFNPIVANNQVFFGGIKATVSSGSSNSLVVSVPSGASFGNIDVVTNGFTASSKMAFDVTNSTGCGILNIFGGYPTGTSPRAVVVGDFNKDGKPDVAVANNTSNTLSVLLGTGSGSLGTKVDYFLGAGNSPNSLAVGDVNGDGNQDLAVACLGTSSVAVFVGSGTGTFSNAGGVNSTGGSPFAIKLADFNQDGFQDIVTSNSSGSSFSILLGIGNATFGVKTDFPLVFSPTDVVVGDFNDDSKLDVALTNTSGTVYVLFGNGLGGFGGVSSYTTGASPSRINTADFNGDGKLDLVTAHDGGGVSVLINSGTGTFPTNSFYSFGGQIKTVAVGDFNGDGKVDLGAASFFTNAVHILLGTGIGTFVSNVGYTIASPFALAVGDFNLDGNQDLATVLNGGSVAIMNSKCPTLSVTTVSATTFAPGANLTVTYSVSNSYFIGNIFTVQLSDASGSFASTIKIGSVSGINPGTISVTIPSGQAAGTGYRVRVVSSNPVTIGADNGVNLTVSSPTPTITTFSPHKGVVGSVITINGTNFDPAILNNKVKIGGIVANVIFASTTKLEVVVPFGASFGLISVESGGKSSFSKYSFSVSNSALCDSLATPTSYLTGNGPTAVATGDFDGDGNPDLATVNQDDVSISVFLGDGLGGLVFNQVYFTGAQPNSIAIGDMNGDGIQDILTSKTADDRFSILRGNGDGTFSFQADVYAGIAPLGIAVADVNNDGLLDVITTEGSSNNLVHIVLNLGGGNFGSPSDYNTPSESSSFAMSDFNEDGNWDIVTLHSSDNVFAISFGDGAGGFSSTPGINTDLFPSSVVVLDFNNDNHQDLAVACTGSNLIQLFRGDGTGLFSLLSNVGNPASSTRSVSVGDFNGDGNQDLVSANGMANSITRFLGNGAGSFSVLDIHTSGNDAYAIAIADFNKDGKQDIANINYGSAQAFVYLTECAPISSIPVSHDGLWFDGVDDFVDVQSLPVSDDFSISFWMKTNQTFTTSGASWYNGVGLVDATDGDNDFGVSMSNGRIWFGSRAGGEFTNESDQTVNDNKWHHITITRDRSSGEVYIYVDGIANGPFFQAAGSLTGPTTMSLGRIRNDPSLAFNGQLDDLRMYDVVLPPSTIASSAFRNFMPSLSDPKLRTYYSMDRNTASGDTEISIKDLKGGTNGVLDYAGGTAPFFTRSVFNTSDNISTVGSLRWAIENPVDGVNNITGKNYIDFSVQETSATAVNTIGISQQIQITDQIIIDGYSAYGSAFNTNPFSSGLNTQLRVELDFSGMGTSPDINAVQFSNVDNSIVRGFSFHTLGNTNGGRQVLNINNGNNNTVSGCWFGIKADGSSPLNSIMNGVYFSGGSLNVLGYDGNVQDPASFNIISNCLYQGTNISGTNHVIQGNYIGVALDGLTAAWNGQVGLFLNGGNNHIVRNNLIGFSGNYCLLANSSNSLIQGNLIGVGIDSVSSAYSSIGFYSSGGSNNTIGGINTGEYNVIANHNQWGVQVINSGAVGNIISGNRIYNNGFGGIILSNGGNNDKPAPTITSTYTNAVSGTTSQSGDIIQVFYDSPQFNGTDQGRIYLGQTTAIGINWTFTATLTTGSRITATATDEVNGTSPFSAAATVTGVIPTYYRSIASGNWSDDTKWQGSTDGITYNSLSAGQYPGALSVGNIVSITGGTIITGTVNPPYPLASITVNGTWFPGANAYTISGQSLILSGGIYNNNATATKTYFVGNVVIQSGGKFLTDVNAYQEFQNGFVNNSSSFLDFSLGGITKFAVNSQVVSGSGGFTNFNDLIQVDSDITVENQNTYINLNGATTSLIGLNANSTWRLGSAGTIYTNSNVELMKGGLLNATLPGTFIAYLGDGQKIKNTNYFGLNIGNPGVKIVEGLVNAVNVGHIAGFSTLSFSGASLSVLSVTGSFYLDVPVGSSVDLSGGGFVHELYLSGAINTISGTFIKGNSKIIYNGAASQNVIALNYNDVEFSGLGVKSLTGPTQAKNVSMNNGIVDLGIYNLTTTGIIPTTPYSATNMIRQTGLSSGGSLVKTGTASGDYLMVYPIGTGSIYSPIEIQDLPSFTGVGNIGMQIVNTTGGTNMVNRMFSLSSSGIGNLAYIDIIFSFDPSEKVGNPTNVHVYNPTKNILVNDVVQATTFNTTGTFINIPLDGLWVAESNTVIVPTVPIGNRGIYFDGVDDVLGIPTSASLDFAGNGNFTVEMWVKVKELNGYYNVATKNAGGGQAKFVFTILNTGELNFATDNGGTGWEYGQTSTPVIEPNKWVHLAFVSNAGNKEIYANGVAQTVNLSGAIGTQFSATTSNSPWEFGTSANGWGGGHFMGQMDEIKIFNTARTAAQIQVDMSSTATGTAGLVGYWNFEDDAAAGNQTMATDVTTNTNDGTLTNGPLWSLRVTDNTNNGSAGLGSLRQAIIAANTDTDRDYIDFSIQQTATGIGAISVIPVPSLIQANNPVFIDGYSAYNSTVNGLSIGSTAQLRIGLNFAGNPGPFGFELLAHSGSKIQGLAFYNMPSDAAGAHALRLNTGLNNSTIEGCWFGINAEGNQATNYNGIVINNTNGILIGGDSPAARNVISGAQFNGVVINGINTILKNNYIGLNTQGNVALSNGSRGVVVNSPASNVIIANNVISGNGNLFTPRNNIHIQNGAISTKVIGNIIGLSADSSQSISSFGDGILIDNNGGSASSNSTIGGFGIGESNIISRNSGYGIFIQNSGVQGHQILGNRIYENTLGGIFLLNGGNNNKTSPLISSASPSIISGTCTSGNFVQVYNDTPQNGITNQGRTFLGVATTIGTNWSFNGTFALGDRITATATDGVNGTSPFSVAATVSSFNPFITTWQTTVANETVTIPTNGSGYNYSVNWGDGSAISTGLTGNATHTYTTPGIYSVAIAGSFPRIFFNNTGDRLKLITIQQWGDIAWGNMANAFRGCSNAQLNASDSPNLAGVTNMSFMFDACTSLTGNAIMNTWNTSSITSMAFIFQGASNFNGDVSSWNVSNVTDMRSMFLGTKFNQDISGWAINTVSSVNMQSMFQANLVFNQNIGGWNVSNVTNMQQLFSGATAFNQNIGGWNVSNVTNMQELFSGATAFNQNISSWNVGNVTNMRQLFNGATAFNQNLGSWDVGKVTNFSSVFQAASNFNNGESTNTSANPLNWNVGAGVGANPINMTNMFFGASKFNQDISAWNTGNVTNMLGTFRNAVAFNQSLASWNLNNLTVAGQMLDGAGLSVANYDASLISWSLQSLKPNISLGANGLTYCNAISARSNIISLNNWTITGDNLSSACIPNMPLGNRGIYLEGNVTSGSNLTTSSLPSNSTDNLTLEAWVKVERFPSTECLVVFNGNSGSNGYGIHILPSGQVTGLLGAQGRVYSNIFLTINQWTHLTIVREVGLWKFYLNGALAGYGTGPFASPNTSAPFIPTTNLTIGNGAGGTNGFAGQIDEVRIFNVARTTAQIQQDIGSNSANGAVGYWNFEESNGNVALDQSGSGNNATFVNNPLRSLRVTDNTDNNTIGLGSLRQAINDANTDTDKDYIDFSLPSGTQTILPTTNYSLNNPVLIDGFSQLNTIPGENSRANTNPFGQPINAKLNVVINGASAGSNDAFLLADSISVIKGLVINGYASSTGFNFSTGSNVNNNKISGCFIGTNRDGTAAVPNNYGFQATGPSNVRTGNTIGGINQEDRNLISGNSIGIADFNTWYNGLIQNNYIGTNAAGNAAIPNFGGGGIEQLLNSQNVIIANNVISGNAGGGVFIASASSGYHVVKGNRIGTTADGHSSLPNGANGIAIFSNSNNTVGGLSIGDANIIANNGANGVSILFSGINNIVLNNSIYNNISSGIDLTSNGNNGKSAPLITNAYTDRVFGTCQSGDLVEVFYDSPQLGATNQGRIYLGQATTIGTNWSFATTLTIGSRITATATDGVNGTSPFSVAATVTSPILAAALDFDGGNDYIISNDLTLADFGTNDFTAESWFKTTMAGNQVIFSNRYEGGNGHFFNLQMFNGNLSVEIDDGLGNYAGNTTIATYNDGIWHHVAMARRGTTANLFVDGSNVITLTTTSIPNVSRGVGFLLGFRYADSNIPIGLFQGQMDEVRLWNRALCGTEILVNKNCEKPSSTSGLVAKYDFNQGFVNANNSSVATLVDSSGNGKNATLYNFSLTSTVSNWVANGAVLSGSTCAGVTIPAGGTWTWVGGNSTDWFSPCNWDKLSVPNATANVIIPGLTPNQPTITNGTAFCNTITVNTDNGGMLNLDSSGGGLLNVTQ